MTAIHIGAQLGIESVAALREDLLPHLRTKRAVTVGIERIDRLHSAALQVLCAFVRDRAQAKGSTRIEAPAELRDAARLLGVADALGLTADGARS